MKDGTKVKRAAEFAEKVHRGAVRKGTSIPYITHPLDTAVIVSMMTEDEELICAALLHDTMEDAGVSSQELCETFGRRVADLVQEETEDKSKSWHERKSATIEHLRHAGRDLKILALADKLSNMRNTARDYLLLGEQIWQRFNVKNKDQQAWYYISILDVTRELKNFPEYEEYGRLCKLVFKGCAYYHLTS